MDTDLFEYLSREADAFVARIKQRVDSQIAREIDRERRTIDIRVAPRVEEKAIEIANQRLKHSEKLNNDAVQRARLQRQATDYVKEGIFWTGVQLGRTIPALTIMGMCGAAGCGFGILIGLNALPSAVACSTVKSWCYSLRANKWTTVAPEIPLTNVKESAPLKKKTKKRS